jgi:hypothetical protein
MAESSVLNLEIGVRDRDCSVQARVGDFPTKKQTERSKVGLDY